MRKMLICGIFFFTAILYNHVYANQIDVINNDSISIEVLFRKIEANSSYRIFSTIEHTFNVVPEENENLSYPEILQGLLKDTPYKISVYKDCIFILKENVLHFNFSSSLTFTGDTNTVTKGQLTLNNEVEKSTSENKIYAVGDMYAENRSTKVTLTGQITDFKSGNPLSGINLFIKEPWTATSTNKKGEFEILLPTGRLQLEISGLNIKSSRRQLMVHSSGSLNIELEEEIHQLDEVVITSSDQLEKIKSTQIGVEKLQIAKIKNIPMAFGEVDILKAIQSLPGVKTVGEASSGFNVRGGATDQNLILLNDGTIYNPNHLFGFFSAFNSDMIKEAEIYKSSIPVKYGGRISSVLDISGKEASKEKLTGSAGIGLVTSKLNLEIPVIKDKTSLLLSGRTTYSDWLLKALPKSSGYSEGKANFYDVGAVFSHKFDDKNLLNIFGYYSHDRFAFNQNQAYVYNNLNISAKWRKVFSNQLHGYFTLGNDQYGYENTESANAASAFKLTFKINQLYIKSDFLLNVNERNKLEFGFKSMYYDINSGDYAPFGSESLVKHDALQKDKALETAFYVGNQWDVNSRFSINGGIRYSVFNALGPRHYNKYQKGMIPYESTITSEEFAGTNKIIKTFHGPEFRLSSRYTINDNLSAKAGFNSMRQYIHKLSNTSIMSPTDTWKLSDYNIQPQSGWQAATGLYYVSPKSMWEFSIEGYYKQMNDYLDYRSGARLLMNHHIETDVISTEGYSYGIEFMLRKTIGKLNGWLGYTYSRTFLRQPKSLIENPVNNGEWYPTEYDKPHDVKFVGNYKFTKRFSLSVNVDYSTGRPTTIPAGKYYDNDVNAMMVFYTDRNSYRIPDYFRTDIAINIEPSHKLSLLTHSSVSIGIYNVTGRQNIYSIYYVSENDKIKGYKLSIFGAPIPFITYNIKF